MITLQELNERDQRPPSVTVYMICYNHEKYLDKAMHGVLMQKTNFPVNIVIHDDASTDRSAEIIRRYADENPNITAILEETNFYQNGKSFFPIVLPHLTGKYIAYCECDDFWVDENKLQIQIDYMENNPDCVAVYSNVVPVNKYGEYDETKRMHYKTGEGDYPHRKFFVVRHQTASSVSRNIWRFMTTEEINLCMNARGNGDQKNLAIFLHMGRVHYFSQEFAAYRYVTDEGDSHSARMLKFGEYYHLKRAVAFNGDAYVMLEKLFGKSYTRKYFVILFLELRSLLKFHKSVLKDVEIDPCYSFKNIPFYVYILLPFYCVYRCAYRVFAETSKRFFPQRCLDKMRAIQRKYFG